MNTARWVLAVSHGNSLWRKHSKIRIVDECLNLHTSVCSGVMEHAWRLRCWRYAPSTMGSFGSTPQALFTVFEPGTAVDIDPFLLSATFDLTPAEARLAAKIVNGQTPEQSAQTLGVKISTIRSQLVAIYGKTGATGQADLVRLVLSATVF